MTITQGVVAQHIGYEEYDKALHITKKVKISPNQTVFIRFYAKKYAQPDYRDYTLLYDFSFDGKTYRGKTWYNGSAELHGKTWYNTYYDDGFKTPA